ncbi:MAG: hypothetical protein ACFBSD_02595 [Paracoccaceae bacterium]
MFNRKLIVGAAALALVASAAHAAPVIIDDFVSESAVRVPALGDQQTSGQFPAPSAVGGERDLQVSRQAGSQAVELNTLSSGILSFNNGVGSRGTAIIDWDGADDALGRDTDGLGGIDLTIGNLPAFVLNFEEVNVGVSYDFSVFDVDGNESVFGPIAVPTATEQTVLLAAFTGTADFSRVGSIRLTLQATQNNADIAISRISVVNTPIPAPLALLTAGLIGLAFVGRRRTA